MQMTCWNMEIKLLMPLKMVLFLSEHLKKSNNAAYNHCWKMQRILLRKLNQCQKINLTLFQDFVESSSPADYAKMLINTEDPDKSKEFVAEIKNNIRFKRQNKGNEWNRKKKCWWDIKYYWKNYWLK